MSLKLGTQDISGISQNTKYNAHHLLDFKWTDCIMNDVSWLRADTFSWQSGDVYTSAYNHLVADLQGTTAETETIGSYTVTFYRATDGHKICLDDQETTVLNIYNETGIAWYYIVDTINTQFKLPRTKYGFEGLRNNVGDMIPQNVLLPNITGNFCVHRWDDTGGYPVDNPTGAFYNSGAVNVSPSPQYSNVARAGYVASFDASRSSSVYSGDGTNTKIQQKATQMYLYFYVGDYTQSAVEQTAGLNSELFNGKVDIDLTNCTKPYVIETYRNGASWYRKWSDGFCEQGGFIFGNGAYGVITVSLLVPFIDVNYVIYGTQIGWNDAGSWYTGTFTPTANGVTDVAGSTQNKTTTNFQTQSCSSRYWMASGYIS